MLFWICYIICWIPIAIMLPTIVINRKKLPKIKDGAYILCANHLSNFDVIMFNAFFGRKIYYLAKKELFKNKSTSWFLTQFGGIKTDREKADIESFKKAMKVLKDGKPLGIFPEGTRNKGNELSEIQEVKSGAIVFAGKAGVPIVPAAIYRRPKLFRCNKILVGDPFYVQGVNPKKLTKEEIKINVNILSETINNLHAQLVQKYSKKK